MLRCKSRYLHTPNFGIEVYDQLLDRPKVMVGRGGGLNLNFGGVLRRLGAGQLKAGLQALTSVLC